MRFAVLFRMIGYVVVVEMRTGVRVAVEQPPVHSLESEGMIREVVEDTIIADGRGSLAVGLLGVVQHELQVQALVQEDLPRTVAGIFPVPAGLAIQRHRS